MFTKNLRFFEQTLHPQWPPKLQNKSLKMASRTLGVKAVVATLDKATHNDRLQTINIVPTIVIANY
jgi:hypothetical protein